MRLAVASDHAGLALKTLVVKWLGELGHTVDDLGPGDATAVDYPDYAAKVAHALTTGAERGVLVCGSGIGMSIAANRFTHVRAALCQSEFDARASRAHNDANLLCLGERVVGSGLARAILQTFLTTGFEGGRHQVRVDKL